jgi:hypothetical protein
LTNIPAKRTVEPKDRGCPKKYERLDQEWGVRASTLAAEALKKARQEGRN